MEKSQSNSKVYSRVRFDEPQRYRVILHNDDFTTMDFVVMILKTIFYKNDADAEAIMLDVHRKGKGVAGVYTRDIAMSKVNKATTLARQNNFPLRLSYEPEQL